MKLCIGCRRKLNRQNASDLCYHCQRESGHGPASTTKSDKLDRLVRVILSDPDATVSQLRERFACSDDLVNHARQLVRERRGAA